MNRRDLARVMIGSALGAGALNGTTLRALAGTSSHGAALTRAGTFLMSGRAVECYWDIGPQNTLDSPELWWHAQNRFAILDEGRNPDQSFIAQDRRVPTRKYAI